MKKGIDGKLLTNLLNSLALQSIEMINCELANQVEEKFSRLEKIMDSIGQLKRQHSSISRFSYIKPKKMTEEASRKYLTDLRGSIKSLSEANHDIIKEVLQLWFIEKEPKCATRTSQSTLANPQPVASLQNRFIDELNHLNSISKQTKLLDEILRYRSLTRVPNPTNTDEFGLSSAIFMRSDEIIIAQSPIEIIDSNQTNDTVEIEPEEFSVKETKSESFKDKRRFSFTLIDDLRRLSIKSWNSIRRISIFPRKASDASSKYQQTEINCNAH